MKGQNQFCDFLEPPIKGQHQFFDFEPSIKGTHISYPCQSQLSKHENYPMLLEISVGWVSPDPLGFRSSISEL
jgi:hypothetical protein